MLRRLSDSDLEDAPTAGYIDAFVDSVNKLNDSVSTPAKPTTIDFLKQCSVEMFEFDMQVPDPWINAALSGSWVDVVAADKSGYMKHYDGSVEMRGNVKSGGAGTNILTLPAGYLPAFTSSFGSDDGAGTHQAFTVAPSTGHVIARTAGVAGLSLNCRFMSSDTICVVANCWPKIVSTKLKTVVGVMCIGVTDMGTASDTSSRPAGNAYSVDFSTVLNKGINQLKINNIPGLPYNRKTHIRLLAIGKLT